MKFRSAPKSGLVSSMVRNAVRGVKWKLWRRRFGLRLSVPGSAEFDRMDLSIFFLCSPKIHILKNLSRGTGHASRKILSCKDLSLKYSRVRTYLRSEGRSGERWWRTGSGSNRACNELALSKILSKGCASQEVSFFLWKAVEKE